jgi:disulfide bond formation protein DsbB
MSIAAVSLISILLKNSKFLRKAVLVMTAISVSFSFYHLGVENKWWTAPGSCATRLPSEDEMKDVAKHIMEAKSTNCDQVNLEIFGVSVTLLTFLLSAGLFWISSVAYAIHSSLPETKRTRQPKLK